MKELTASTGRIAAFAELNWKNGGDNGVELENSGVSGVEPEKIGVKRQITGKIAAFTAFLCRYKGTQCV